MRLTNATFRFTNQWVLDVKRPAKNTGKAKSEMLSREEFHGDLERCVVGAKRYLTTEDLPSYKKLYDAMIEAIRAFRELAEFDFQNKVQWQVVTPDSKHHHVVQTCKNHGAVRLMLVTPNDHHLATSDFAIDERFPGNHKQAAMAILSRDVGEFIKANPQVEMDDVVAFIKQRVSDISVGLLQAGPADYTNEVDDEIEQAELADDEVEKTSEISA